MKKHSYYVATTGFFNAKIRICFSDEQFQQALKDCKITTRHNALDLGIAESHYIQQEGTQNCMLAIAFDFDEMAKDDALERMGTIYHEVSHTVTHIFQHIGEEVEKIGDETRSYLGEHLFKQVFAAYATEEDKRERLGKGNRKALDKANQAVIGALLQMAEHDNGSAGSNSVPKPESVSGGIKNRKRNPKSTPNSSI
jgi:hypothetical protein